MIVTNGYGLTPENISLLETCRVTAAQITLDGAAAFHDVRRSLLGGQETFSRILKNLKRVLSETRIQISVRVNIDARNRDSIHGLLEYLAEQGFGYRKTFSVYFAPVEAITDGCHSVASLCMTKSEHGELETELTRTAYKLGLAPLPYPPRYRGICGAVRPGGLVILPSGDLHKCWDTVSMPEHKVGTIYQAELLEGDKRALRWAQWTPFDNNICTSCRILPNCVGSCAHKFLNAEQTLGEAASLPCPSWKFNMRERLLLMAEGTGALSKDDLPDQMEPDRLHIGSAPGWAERYAAHAVARQAAAGLVSIKVAHP
jgi:uncharacterized protein